MMSSFLKVPPPVHARISSRLALRCSSMLLFCDNIDCIRSRYRGRLRFFFSFGMAFCDVVTQCHDNVLKYLNGDELASAARTCSAMRHLAYTHDACWKYSPAADKPESVTWREEYNRCKHAQMAMAGRSVPNATMDCGSYVRHLHVYHTVVLVITQELDVYVHSIDIQCTRLIGSMATGVMAGASYVSATSCGRRTLLTTSHGMVSLVIRGQQAVHTAVFGVDAAMLTTDRLSACFVNEHAACMVGNMAGHCRFGVAHFENEWSLHANSTLVGHLVDAMPFDRIVHMGDNACLMSDAEGTLCRIDAFSWAQEHAFLPPSGTVDAMKATETGSVVIMTSSFSVFVVHSNLTIVKVGEVAYIQSLPVAIAAYRKWVMVFPYFQQYVIDMHEGQVCQTIHSHSKHVTACAFTDTHAFLGGCHGELFSVRL